MDGGGWLTVAGTPVDVIYRDLDRVESWLEDARHGRFEILVQNGYVVDAPTYLPVGELALCRPLSGELPRPEFPEALAETASARWRGRAGVALMFARGHAELGDAVACTGMLAQAVLCAAHAWLAGRRDTLNEKRLVERAGLSDAQAALASAGTTSAELTASVAAVSRVLGIAPLAPR